jgi:hypothetical protein
MDIGLTVTELKDCSETVCQRQYQKRQCQPIESGTLPSQLLSMRLDGNVRKVQKLSRHRQLDTLMIYDDNRGKDQQEVTALLDDMVSDMNHRTMTEEQWLAVFLNSLTIQNSQGLTIQREIHNQ